jgi:uncharacterized protein
MGRVVHFEIHADDVARAKQFYEDVFGWKISKWGEQDYWTIMTGKNDAPASDDAMSQWGGIDGGLVPRKGKPPTYDNPVSAYVCTIQVEKLDASLEKVLKHAGNVVVQKYAIPTVGWLCYCKDTEGNIFGLLEADEKAG